MNDIQSLGESKFNYQDYTVWRFIHYYQQINHIMKLKPSRILELGPGDHTITDFLRRKNFYVKTFDNNKELHTDYFGDIREKLIIPESFDLVIASEVFEHANVKYLDQILKNINEVLIENGYLIVSLPYSTLRLFPRHTNYGKIASCSGVLYTYLPMYFFQPIFTIMRGFKKILVNHKKFCDAFKLYKVPEYPDDKFDVHHWDLGYFPTTRRYVRSIFQQTFVIVEEKTYINTNCVFFTLQKKTK